MAQSSQELNRSQVNQSQIDFKQNIMLKVLQYNEQNNQVNIATMVDTIAQKRYEVAKRDIALYAERVIKLKDGRVKKDELTKQVFPISV